MSELEQSPEASDEQSSDRSTQHVWDLVALWAGAIAIGTSLAAGSPYVGSGVMGRWRTALTALGLLAIGAGLIGLMRRQPWHIAAKAAVVVGAVAALEGLAIFGIDQVPITPAGCTDINGPTIENRGPVYCLEGDGTLVRITVTNVVRCSNGGFSSTTNYQRQWGRFGWSTEWNARGCPL